MADKTLWLVTIRDKDGCLIHQALTKAHAWYNYADAEKYSLSFAKGYWVPELETIELNGRLYVPVKEV